MTRRILFYVQHLMGVGHVFRAMRIVRALVDAGHTVDLVHGGLPIPNFDAAGAMVHLLPPLKAGTSVFNDLEDGDGKPAGDDYKARRRDMLLTVFEAGGHDALITEAFPFGRRQMRFELMPLLEAAKRRAKPPVVIASVRDILQENRKPGRDRETVATLKTHFDHVLVHGDPDFAGLDLTFPLYTEIVDMVRHTGIVAPEPPMPPASASERFDVVVSVGGGALGRELLFAAAGAKPLSKLADARWCIVTGLGFAEKDRVALESALTGDVELCTFLPDLASAMAAAELSISRCGYNTTADIFATGCRAIVVPLADGTETEQLRRAELLDRKGYAARLDPAEQTPAKLATAIDRAMERQRTAPPPVDLGGAAETARLVSQILAERP